jgi:hypothetical protein
MREERMNFEKIKTWQERNRGCEPTMENIMFAMELEIRDLRVACRLQREAIARFANDIKQEQQ